MSARERRAAWARLAKVIGPGRRPSAQQIGEWHRIVMDDVRAGRNPYPPCLRAATPTP